MDEEDNVSTDNFEEAISKEIDSVVEFLRTGAKTKSEPENKDISLISKKRSSESEIVGLNKRKKASESRTIGGEINKSNSTGYLLIIMKTFDYKLKFFPTLIIYNNNMLNFNFYRGWKISKHRQ
jgi:hypothetical protein